MTINDKTRIFNGEQYNSSSNEVFDNMLEAIEAANLRRDRKHAPQIARVKKETVYRVYFRPEHKISKVY